jgi:hypothetical protein
VFLQQKQSTRLLAVEGPCQFRRGRQFHALKYQGFIHVTSTGSFLDRGGSDSFKSIC